MKGARVVVLDDEQNMGRVLTKLLKLEGCTVTAFQSPREALEHLFAEPPDVLITDLRMPEMDGEEVLERVRDKGLPCEVILMTAYGTVESAVRCVRHGAYDYITKPFDTKALVGTVRQAAASARRKYGAGTATPSPTGEMHRLVGSSPAMEQTRGLIERYAQVDSPVLIAGESGTGKELVAQAIHAGSPRHNAPFVAVNCASIPETLMESELFGHEKGAFTGADESRAGLMEAADGGTLFLDEIGELPLGLQAKLLRALQEKEITRVGSVHPRPVNVRILAATNRSLFRMSEGGTFRQDLYYRLNVLRLTVPPLRERRGDIRELAEHFLAEQRTASGKPDLHLAPDALGVLENRGWPGNVRELRNAIERAAVLCDGDEIDAKELHAGERESSREVPRLDVPGAPGAEGLPEFREARDQFEADYLSALLRSCKGNVSEAAKRSGMSRRNLYDKLEKLHLDPAQFKG